MFPVGLPDQFSFVSTFKMASKTRKERWNIIQIVDSNQKPQFGIRLDGGKKIVEFYYTNYNGRLSTLSFTRAKKVGRVYALYFL